MTVPRRLSRVLDGPSPTVSGFIPAVVVSIGICSAWIGGHLQARPRRCTAASAWVPSGGQQGCRRTLLYCSNVWPAGLVSGASRLRRPAHPAGELLDAEDPEHRIVVPDERGFRPRPQPFHAAIHGQFERDIAEEVDESDCKNRSSPESTRVRGTESRSSRGLAPTTDSRRYCFPATRMAGIPCLDPDLTDHQGVSSSLVSSPNGPQLSDGISNENGESATRKASNQPRSALRERIPSRALVRACDGRHVDAVEARRWRRRERHFDFAGVCVLVTGRKLDPVSRGVVHRVESPSSTSPHASS